MLGGEAVVNIFDNPSSPPAHNSQSTEVVTVTSASGGPFGLPASFTNTQVCNSQKIVKGWNHSFCEELEQQHFLKLSRSLKGHCLKIIVEKRPRSSRFCINEGLRTLVSIQKSAVQEPIRRCKNRALRYIGFATPRIQIGIRVWKYHTTNCLDLSEIQITLDPDPHTQH
jgi:hypothetical protein